MLYLLLQLAFAVVAGVGVAYVIARRGFGLGSLLVLSGIAVRLTSIGASMVTMQFLEATDWFELVWVTSRLASSAGHALSTLLLFAGVLWWVLHPRATSKRP